MTGAAAAADNAKTLFELLYQGRCVQQGQPDNLIFQLLQICHLSSPLAKLNWPLKYCCSRAALTRPRAALPPMHAAVSVVPENHMQPATAGFETLARPRDGKLYAPLDARTSGKTNIGLSTLGMPQYKLAYVLCIALSFGRRPRSMPTRPAKPRPVSGCAGSASGAPGHIRRLTFRNG